MNNTKNTESLEHKRDGYLLRACEAENRKDFIYSARLFQKGVYCDARTRLNVADAKKYVEQAGPLYEPSTVIAGI